MFTTPLHLPRPFQTYLLPALPFHRRRNSSTTSRDSNNTVSSTATSVTSSSTHAQAQEQPQAYLNTTNHPTTSTISCSRCHAHLALTTQIISKGFTGRHGRAYLVSSSDPTLTHSTHAHSLSPKPSNQDATHRVPAGTLPNTHTHKPMPRNLVTGAHTVSDVSCAVCGAVLGWKYVAAAEEAQRYKVGKFILETRRVAVRAVWDDLYDYPDNGAGDGDVGGRGVEERGGAGDGGKEGVKGGAKARVQDAKVEVDEEVVFDSQDEDECEDLFAGNWSAAAARRRRARRLCVKA